MTTEGGHPGGEFPIHHLTPAEQGVEHGAAVGLGFGIAATLLAAENGQGHAFVVMGSQGLGDEAVAARNRGVELFAGVAESAGGKLWVK